MTPERFRRIQSVLNQRQPDLTVITDEVHKGRNIAAVVRTCDAVGIDTIHTVTPSAGYQRYQGTAMGSQKWVEVKEYDQIQEPVQALKSQGFQILVAHLSETAVDYRQIDYTSPTGIILGTEKQGVSESAAILADQHITVPMMGMVASLNVSVACAIILTEACRQRQQAGLYDQRRLPEVLYRQRLFCWCHPQLADYCHQHALAYPLMNDQGDIIDGPGWYQQARAQLQK